MSQYGAGKCVLCGAVDDYCQIGAYQNIDCRDLATVFRAAEKMADSLRHDDLTLLMDARTVLKEVDYYKQIVVDDEITRADISRFENEENSG